MSRRIVKLTKAIIAEAAAGDKAYVLWDIDVGGFGLTFASITIANGVPLYSAGKFLGLASMQTTSRYAHLDEGTMQLVADPVSSLVASQMTSTLAEVSPAYVRTDPNCLKPFNIDLSCAWRSKSLRGTAGRADRTGSDLA